MELLLNSNIAYLALVVAILLGIFAILTPGTGVFEISALIALLLVGWQVINLPVNVWALVVLLAGVLPFLLALRSARRNFYLSISILALIVGSVFLFRGEVWWTSDVNPAFALVVSALAGGLLWIMTQKVLEARDIGLSHDLGSIVGSIGEARTDIHHEGSVYVIGELWTARSVEPIPEGARVEVTGREGLVLEVRLLKEEN